MSVQIFFLLFFLSSCASFNPQNREEADLHLRVGTSLLENQKYPQALSELLKAEHLDPNNAVIQNNLGLAYFARERVDLAERHISKSVKLDAKFTEAKNNLGRVYIEQQKFEQAEKTLNEALLDLTYPESEKIYLNLGLSSFRQKKFQIAKKFFLKSLELKRANCRSQTYYGRTLYELQDFAAAAQQLDRAVGFCQGDSLDEPQYYSGLSHYSAGDVTRARDRLSELIRLYPDSTYYDRARKILQTMK